MKIWYQPTQNHALQWIRYYSMERFLPDNFHSPKFDHNDPDVFWEKSINEHHPDMVKHFENIIDKGYKAAIFQRIFTLAGVYVIDLLKRNGIRVFTEIDDSIELGSSHPMYNNFENSGAKDCCEEQLRLSDGIIVTTDSLKKEFETYNSNVEIIRNTLDARWMTKHCCNNEMKRKKSDKIRIVYACSSTHNADIEAVYPYLLRLQEEFADKIEIILFGGVSAFADRKDGIIKKPASYKILDYYGALSDLGFHIGIAPLIEKQFNLAKSNLRFLEYSAMSAVTVASNIGDFKKPIADGHCFGASFGKKDDWYFALKRVIMLGKDELENLGYNAKAYSHNRYNTMDEANKLIKFVTR